MLDSLFNAPMIVTTSVLVVVALGLAAYFAPQLLQLSWTRRVRARCQQQHAIVLTFDDGPGAELTPRLLDLLDSHDARATFYSLGCLAEVNTEIEQLILRRGHEIATHSQEHRHAWKTMPWTIARDVAGGFRTMAAIRSAESDSTIRFRPTYGKLTLASALVAWCRRAPIDWWTIVSGDTHKTLPSPASVLAKLERDGGGVILLHDFDRTGAGDSERADYVLAMTDLLCRRGREMGLTPMTMREMMDNTVNERKQAA